MAKLTKKQVEAVKRIVISYAAWQEYRDNCIENPKDTDSRKNMIVWSKILIDDQRALGVELVNHELLRCNADGFVYAAWPKGGEAFGTNDINIALGD